MGALAALRYRGEPRLTTDLDLLVERGRDLAGAFRRAGYEVTEIADPAEPPHLLLIRGNGIQADLMLATVEHQRVALDRAADGVLTAEDVVIHKLRARDRDDVLSILRAAAPLDEAYVDRWAEMWGVTDRWEEARRAR